MVCEALPLQHVNSLLGPGPVALLTTTNGQEQDVMALSSYLMMEFEPTLVGCVIGDKCRSHDFLLDSSECVLNIPGQELTDAVIGCGNTSGFDVDKFKRFGLTTRRGSMVAAPLINECFANLECELVDRSRVEQYCFFVFQVLRGWIDPDRRYSRTLHHRGHGRFMIAGDEIHRSSQEP